MKNDHGVLANVLEERVLRNVKRTPDSVLFLFAVDFKKKEKFENLNVVSNELKRRGSSYYQMIAEI